MLMLVYLVQGMVVVLGQHVVWSWSRGEFGVSPGQQDPGGGHAPVWCCYSLFYMLLHQFLKQNSMKSLSRWTD